MPSAVFERDIAGESFGNDHVYRAFADIVAFHEAVIVEMREIALAQDAAGLAHLLQPLYFLDADIEQANGWPLDIEQHARHSAAHGGEIDQVHFVGADRGPDIEHDRLAFDRRPKRCDRRTFDALDHLEVEACHGH